ncbi:F-box domain-containing protein [Mycena sanguinolenta]|uniref:F-box domain-containing protein n=1 Tax=Mycena sanguinolenta TaxID=230812 RepID=A0A8H7CRZ7_9AGAR|nr:F-box domain-containing protein [Mycena sanguinolenta]
MSLRLTDVSSGGGGDPAILLLPPEITVDIFHHCLPSPTPGFESHSWPSPQEAPLLLAQVCCQWRDISLSTPQLWASIAFEKGAIELLELWLSRTGNHPLTISLRAVDEQRAFKFMQAIIRHNSRWQNVHLVLPLIAIRQLELSCFPCLTRLALWTVGAGQWTRAPPVTIQGSPLLRYADIHFLPQFNLPLEQLTSLHFHHSLGVAQTVAILQRCPNLLELSSLNLGIGSTPVFPPVELRFLRSLKTDDTRLFSSLTLPHLELLEILAAIDTAADALRPLIARSSCDLKFLSLRVHKATVPQLQRLLRTTPSVVHLKLDRAWLEFQMQVLQGADILPRLQHLEIYYHGPGHHYRPLLDMLRWRQGQGIKSCKLCQRSMSLAPPPADTLAEFCALAKAGLQIRVSRDQSVLLDTLQG